MLLYGLDDHSADKTQILLEQNGIAAYIVGDDVLDQPLSALLKAEEDFDGRHQAFDCSFMVFDGIDVNELIRTLSYLREHGAEFDGVKIMRTDANSDWVLKELFTHTRREHELARKAMILQEMIASCNGINLTDADTKAKTEFKKALMEAFMLLKSGQYTDEAMDRAIRNLSSSMKGVTKLYN